MSTSDTQAYPKITGRCYCGATGFAAHTAPLSVTYCHCSDCRRVTGAPVAVFAAFSDGSVGVSENPTPHRFEREGVIRQSCARCASPISARFSYIPEQVFIPLGLFDDPNSFPPQHHAHTQACLSWFALSDDLPRHSASARDSLQTAAGIRQTGL